MNSGVRSEPFGSRPPEAALYSIRPPICFAQAHRLSNGIHSGDPMMTSDEKCKKEGLMTRKLLLTAAIVALAFAPSIGTGTAQARGFFGGGRLSRRIRARLLWRIWARLLWPIRFFLSGLLPLWLFPLRLLPLLIACSLRPETAQPGALDT